MQRGRYGVADTRPEASSSSQIMPKYSLTAVMPSKPEGLSCRYLIASPEETDGMRVLIVSFDGNYPDGSLGNAHGHYIASSTLHGLHVFDPDCVVIDFRLLAYRWGNTLLRVFRDISDFKDAGAVAGEPRFPVTVVTSKLCRDGFLSLVTPSGAAAPGWHFDDVDAAITYAVQASKEWLDFPD
jgi:hypothetical protein